MRSYDRSLGISAIVRGALYAGPAPGVVVSWDEVRATGAGTVVSLAELEGAPPDGFGWRRFFVEDADPDEVVGVTAAWLEGVLRCLAEERAARRVVYLHCFAGISRTGLVLAAWAMREQGLDAAAAIAWVRTRRACVSPNPGFRAFLERWDASLPPPDGA